MTVHTPKFIIHECERLIKVMPIEHWQKAYAIRKQLNRMNNVKEAVRLVECMMQLEEAYVNPRMTPRLFRRSLISMSLTKALEQYENQEEARDVQNIVRKLANFELSLCQVDEDYQWDRTFNVVTSLTEWRRICARAEVLINKGSTQIALEIKKPKKLKTAEKALLELSRDNGQNQNNEKKYYDIWFRQMDRVHYYVYLP